MRGRVLVIGGGTNGLAAAVELARSGAKVTLVERRDVLGGIAAGEEFHPGFRTTGLLHDSATLRPAVVRDLELERFGLELVDEPPSLALELDGDGILCHRDAGRTSAEIARRSPADAEAYAAWRAFLGRVRGFVARVLSEEAPDLDPSRASEILDLLRTGVALRRLGEADMLELLRVGPMAVADWMKDEFEDERLRAALAAPALTGTWLGPWSAGSAACLLAHESTTERAVRGGPAGLVRALAEAARAAGVEIVLGAAVAELVVESGAVRGAVFDDGSELAAERVLSTIEPRHLMLELVPRIHLPADEEDAIRPWRTRGTTAKLHLALDGPLEAACRPGETFERMTTGESLDELERAFDAIKYGGMSERPVLDVRVPTQGDPTLAPSGQHVVSVLAHYCPHALEGGWTAEARGELERRVLAVLEEYAPGVGDRTLAVETLSPTDLEERYALPGGHVHHGEHALDQLLFLRPTPGSGHHATPIGGLFLGGSGSHPGGGVTCMPGVLAARRLARS